MVYAKPTRILLYWEYKRILACLVYACLRGGTVIDTVFNFSDTLHRGAICQFFSDGFITAKEDWQNADLCTAEIGTNTFFCTFEAIDFCLICPCYLNF